jgi:cytidylate kinase
MKQMQTNHQPRMIERLVDDRIKLWEAVPAEEKPSRRRPVVAISRQVGSLGQLVAERLAGELGMELYADQLISAIADKTHMSESVVRTLDEKGVTFLDDMLKKIIGKYGLTSDEYINVLARIVATLDWHGNSVIVGRGSAYMIHGPDDLKVRFVAPVAMRIRNIRNELDLTEDEARKHVEKIDAERRHFVHRYFHVDIDDATHFDMVINNESMDLDASLKILKAALHGRDGAVREEAE